LPKIAMLPKKKQFGPLGVKIEHKIRRWNYNWLEIKYMGKKSCGCMWFVMDTLSDLTKNKGYKC